MRSVLALVLAIAAFVALSIVWILSDHRAPRRIYDTYSSANTGDAGLSLASAYLAKQRKVAMLTRPMGRVPLEKNAVVFRITKDTPVHFDPEDLEPGQYGPPKPRSAPMLGDADEAFVRSGGRMIIAARRGMLERLNLTGSKVKKVFPIWPEVGDLDAGKFASGFRSLPPRMHALFAQGAQAVIARQRIGNGEVYAVSSPDFFRNGDLKKKHNLALLAALAGDTRPVYFDEVPHGIVSDDGALALLKEWNLGVFLLLLIVLAVLIFWRSGARVGPPEEIERDTRSDAVDLVRSLGTLYRGVTSDAAAIALYHETLTRTVAAQTGLRGEMLHKKVAELTGDVGAGFSPHWHGLKPVPTSWSEDISAAEFKRSLDAINEGFLRHASRR